MVSSGSAGFCATAIGVLLAQHSHRHTLVLRSPESTMKIPER